jgi:putative ABC transport system permease protein
MMLLLISLVRGDLLAEWRDQLPPDAPNYFLINVQPGEMMGVKELLAEKGLASAAFYPMVRGRLVAINDAPVNPDDYPDTRAQRLAARDFNLSWSAEPRTDNRIVEGRWWTRDEHGKPLLSVETGIAEALGFRLGDTLTFQVGGQTVSAAVQSIRTVEWDSFRVNFFVVAPPRLLDGYPATYITSFHLPGDARDTLIELVRPASRCCWPPSSRPWTSAATRAPSCAPSAPIAGACAGVCWPSSSPSAPWPGAWRPSPRPC